MLVASLVLLAACCLALGAACGWLLREQRRLAQRLATQATESEARLLKRLDALARRIEVYQAGSVSMGEELRELRALAEPLPERMNQLEQRDPGSLSFSQAARLIELGASVEDLTRTCGLSQAEAELMRRLRQP